MGTCFQKFPGFVICGKGKTGVDKLSVSSVKYPLPTDGRLAQLVAHPLDVREVTGSSPVSSTKAYIVLSTQE